jgi:hypothetical protein
LNLRSLDQKTFDKIYRKIAGMRDSIKNIWETKREIFCIMDNQLYPSPPKVKVSSPKGFVEIDIARALVEPPPSNYSWLPVRINLYVNKRGTYFDICDMRFEKYLNLVKEWKFVVDLFFPTDNVLNGLYALLTSMSPIAMNKSQKIIAGSLRRVDLNRLPTPQTGAIHLLPPPSDSRLFEAIEELINIVLGTPTKVVLPWRKAIEIPNEEILRRQIEAKRTEIAKLESEISQLQKQIQRWDSYRDLLTESGENLELTVQKTLAELGIKTERTEKGFPADLISRKVAIEITGIKGCLGTSSEKLNQIGRFNQFHRNREKIMLIANTHMDLPPKERVGKMNFSPEAEKYFEALSVCYLSTLTLFQLWRDVILGKIEKEKIKEKILTKIGELTIHDFE